MLNLNNRLPLVVLALLFAALAACAPAAPTPTAAPTAAPTESAAAAEPTAQPTTEPTRLPATEAPPQAAAVDRPAWQTLPLVDARTGENFTLGDFTTKTVYVEPMATWCTNCRQQLGIVSGVQTAIDSDKFVFVALSVETNISSADLAAYAADNGFNWVFAVMTPELLGALVDTFGRTITNPPSTPHFIIRPDGTFTDLSTGIHGADELIAQLNAATQG